MDHRPHELVIVVDEVVLPTRLLAGESRVLGSRVGEKGVSFWVQPVKHETPFSVEDGSGRLLLSGTLCPESL
jgi:hypothetical protein